RPDGDLLPCQAVFTKEAPVFEADIAMLIKRAGKLCRIQHAGEHLVGVGASQHAMQHCLWAVAPILALLVSKVMFGVVVLPPRLVRLLNLRTGARIGEAVVGEPPLDRDYVELTLTSQDSSLLPAWLS